MMGECTCTDREREAIESVPWQRDHCNTCGYPIPDTAAPQNES